MRKGKKGITWLTVIALAASLMAGCGAKEKVPEETQDKSSAGDESTVKEEETGGILRMSMSMEPTEFLSTDISFLDSYILASFVMERLGRLDKAGQMEPFLAEEFIENPEDMTLTVRLKDGIKYSDGSTLDAENVKWNIEYVQEVKASLGAIESVEAVDPKTVVITYSEWNSSGVNQIGGLFMMSSQAFEELGEDGFQKKPVGTGPFLFDSWDAGEKISLVRQDNYWGEGPYIDGVEFKLIEDAQARLSAFMAGELDVISPGINEAETLDAAGYPCVSENPVVGGMLRGLIFNTLDEGPLQDVKVREAVCHAVNREEVIQAVSGGKYPMADQFSAKGFWSYNDNLETYQYDIEKCKELLAEAGYEDGITLPLTYPASDVELVTIMQGVLEKAGFTIEMNSVEQSVFDQAVVGGGGWDGIAMWTSGSGQEINGFNDTFGEHPFFFCSSLEPVPEIVELINEGKAATSQEDIKVCTDKLQELICVKHCLVCPVFMPSTFFYTQKNISDMNIGIESVNQLTPQLIKIK